MRVDALAITGRAPVVLMLRVATLASATGRPAESDFFNFSEGPTVRCRPRTVSADTASPVVWN